MLDLALKDAQRRPNPTVQNRISGALLLVDEKQSKQSLSNKGFCYYGFYSEIIVEYFGGKIFGGDRSGEVCLKFNVHKGWEDFPLDTKYTNKKVPTDRLQSTDSQRFGVIGIVSKAICNLTLEAQALNPTVDHINPALPIIRNIP